MMKIIHKGWNSSDKWCIEKGTKDAAMRHLVTCIILGACCYLVQSSIVEDKIFIFQKSGDENNKKVLVVTWPYEGDDTEDAMGCEVFTNPQLIEEVLKASKGELIRTPSEEDLKEVIKECTEISRRRRRETGSFVSRLIAWKRNRRERSRKVDSEKGEDKNKNLSNSEENSTEPDSSGGILSNLPVIFPGTNWCGSGDVAKSYDDLGTHKDTDICCRAHDVCNDTMASGETKNNLTNDSSFTKLSCQCDDDFYDCLEKVNSLTSNTVGNMYFNLLRRECYAKDYPSTKTCKKYRTLLKLGCEEYEKDTQAREVFQWFPAKKYSKIPVPIVGGIESPLVGNN